MYNYINIIINNACRHMCSCIHTEESYCKIKHSQNVPGFSLQMWRGWGEESISKGKGGLT